MGQSLSSRNQPPNLLALIISLLASVHASPVPGYEPHVTNGLISALSKGTLPHVVINIIPDECDPRRDRKFTIAPECPGVGGVGFSFGVRDLPDGMALIGCLNQPQMLAGTSDKIGICWIGTSGRLDIHHPTPLRQPENTLIASSPPSSLPPTIALLERMALHRSGSTSM